MCKIHRAVSLPPDAQPSDTPSATRIPARSRGQAMDWSLVLASQGIEHAIDGPEENGWGLIVAESDHSAALASIRLFRRDNRRWSWRKTISTDGAIFDGVSLVWVALTVVFYWLSVTRAGFREAGVLDGSAVAAGEWWRLFTATLLHANLMHLASNALFGFILLGLAAGCYGTGLGLLAAFLAGVGGNLASLALHGKSMHGLGASGVVMGALGLVAVHSIAHLKTAPGSSKLFIGGLAGGVMLFTLLGLSPGTDTIAHFGGFVAGVAIGGFLALLSPAPSTARVNFVAGLGFLALIIWTWALALGRIG